MKAYQNSPRKRKDFENVQNFQTSSPSKKVKQNDYSYLPQFSSLWNEISGYWSSEVPNEYHNTANEVSNNGVNDGFNDQYRNWWTNLNYNEKKNKISKYTYYAATGQGDFSTGNEDFFFNATDSRQVFTQENIERIKNNPVGFLGSA